CTAGARDEFFLYRRRLVCSRECGFAAGSQPGWLTLQLAIRCGCRNGVCYWSSWVRLPVRRLHPPGEGNPPSSSEPFRRSGSSEELVAVKRLLAFGSLAISQAQLLAPSF